MEFFEFDNSFIGGYGELTTNLKSGDTLVTVTAKGFGFGNGEPGHENVQTTCNMVQTFKNNNTTIVGGGAHGGNCIDGLPYATKGSRIIKGDEKPALKPGGIAKFTNQIRK